MSYIAGMDYTLSPVHPEDDAAGTVDGFGNYNLDLYFVESWTTLEMLQAWIWMGETMSTSLFERHLFLLAGLCCSLNRSRPLLSFSFHIPLPEASNLTGFAGVKQEAFDSARYNSGFYSTLVGTGDVWATTT